MEFATAFANLVTVPSDKPEEWVARRGDESIFSVLSKIIPEVANCCHNRCTLSYNEFN